MEILNQGSFVPLDNRERIEQLKFTSKEMATEVAKSDCFENNGRANQQIALEMWKGSAYMCRAYEENTVRNIFLSTFLERLRELANVTRVQPPPAQSLPSSVSQSAPIIMATVIPPPVVPAPLEPLSPAVIETSPKPLNISTPELPAPARASDEFLGIVPSIEEGSQGSYADECVPEYDPAIEALVDRLESEEPNLDTSGPSEMAEAIKKESATPAVELADQRETVTVSSAITDVRARTDVIEDKTESEAKAEPSKIDSVESLVLAEKEPYNFDSCTITSVIHLFPESDGIRKCVVGVRSHDFTPQITTAEVANDSIAEEIRQRLETAFEQYRTALPALAAEKIKKEKPAARKRTAKPAEKTKAANKTEEPKADTAQVAQVSQAAAQGQSSLFAS